MTVSDFPSSCPFWFVVDVSAYGYSWDLDLLQAQGDVFLAVPWVQECRRKMQSLWERFVLYPALDASAEERLLRDKFLAEYRQFCKQTEEERCPPHK